MIVLRMFACAICLVMAVYFINENLQPLYRIPLPFMRSRVQHADARPDDLGMVSYLASRWIIGPSKSSLNLSVPNRTDFSQVGQSVFVDSLLKGRTGGFFVECGASTGEELSNTLFFERERGWSGLLIEANPIFFQELLRKHRKAYLINACLSGANTTTRVNFYPGSWYGGLNPTEHTDQPPITVQCFPLYSILLAINQTRVDYLSLDVEGSELGILRTIPFRALYIDVIGVEYRSNVNSTLHELKSKARLYAIRHFFQSLGNMYKEVAKLPWGTASNRRKLDGYGLDVFYKHT